ncbi:hypothetical protein F2Q68_00033981 [Brassica cretica]|uniref:Putative plant transposon protein domain-containing protein n=1 Tax=Brassica cretica TaxID=69181 RepID=A0A8S9GX61_BRACR|nr:hypothetical protein F2Q68_00033981 [Brassica cretica]
MTYSSSASIRRGNRDARSASPQHGASPSPENAGDHPARGSRFDFDPVVINQLFMIPFVENSHTWEDEDLTQAIVFLTGGRCPIWETFSLTYLQPQYHCLYKMCEFNWIFGFHVDAMIKQRLRFLFAFVRSKPIDFGRLVYDQVVDMARDSDADKKIILPNLIYQTLILQREITALQGDEPLIGHPQWINGVEADSSIRRGRKGRINVESAWYLGAFMPAEKRGYELVHQPSILKTCNVTHMVNKSPCEIGIYVSGVDKGIKVLEANVPTHGLSTLALGIFYVCLGEDIEANNVFQQFTANHVDLDSNAIYEMGDELESRLIQFHAPFFKTNGPTLKFPDDNVIDTPTCLYGHTYDVEYEEGCKYCMLFCLCLKISHLL